MEVSNLKITHIGHATALIQLGRQFFLTDPNFSNRIWPRHGRQQPPGIPAYRLPDLSAILISHGKYDHLDFFSFKYFKSTVPIIVPQGLGKLVRKFLRNPVTELSPEGVHHEKQIEIHAVPTFKKGYRHLPFRYTAATGYVLVSPQATVYFPGDTAYGDHFKEIGQKFKIDVALLPIQPTKGKGAKGSLSPLMALQALEDLGARTMVPMRWDTFHLGTAKLEDLVPELKKIARERGVEDRVRVLQPGESLEI